jgi:murein DD-endopeptidase MepM/ murein hydrolase activator NlpD
MFPLPGYKASHGFGEYRKAEPGKKAHRHAGEDVPALKGTKIFPMGEKGVVVYVGEATNFGENTIIISYPGIEDEKGNIAYSVYGHCNAAYVKAGDIVNRDTPVGEVGDDHSSSSHLHYQVHFGPPGLGREIFAYAPSDPRKFLIS